MKRYAAAIEALRCPGAVVFYPTETVYGIGGRASDGASARRIAELKDRPLMPLIVLVDGIPAGLDGLARRLAERFWPGPLTLVVPGSVLGNVCDEVRGPGGSLALRWSGHPVASLLVREVGPITSTSANRSGEPPLITGACPFPVDAVMDVGPLAPAPSSTLVDVSSGRILRRGGLADRVEAFLAAP